MPNANYLKGRRKEYKRMSELKADGWTVLRTAGSHGLFDVIAIKPPYHDGANIARPGHILLIQLKSGKSMEMAIKTAAKEVLGFDGTYNVEAKAE